VAHGIFHQNLIELLPAHEFDGQAVRYRTLIGVVIIARELEVFDAIDLVPQDINSGVLRDFVLVIRGG
jgi:hypothetical protein